MTIQHMTSTRIFLTLACIILFIYGLSCSDLTSNERKILGSTLDSLDIIIEFIDDVIIRNSAPLTSIPDSVYFCDFRDSCINNYNYVHSQLTYRLHFLDTTFDSAYQIVSRRVEWNDHLILYDIIHYPDKIQALLDNLALLNKLLQRISHKAPKFPRYQQLNQYNNEIVGYHSELKRKGKQLKRLIITIRDNYKLTSTNRSTS